METVEITVLFDKQIDKNGTPMRCGKTAEYLDSDGNIHLGRIVCIYNSELFDKFVVGCQVVLS